MDDNTATVASLDILANSVIELKEENEIHEISDSEEVPKKRRDEGGGFGGTVLGRTHDRSSSPPAKPVEGPPAEKACGTCTYSNPVDQIACGMCNSTLV